MTLTFTGETIYWRGPAPFIFVEVPDAESKEIKSISKQVTYGWGCIPVTAIIGNTTYKTALFPKNNRYLVPVKVAVQRAENVNVGEVVTIQLEV